MASRRIQTSVLAFPVKARIWAFCSPTHPSSSSSSTSNSSFTVRELLQKLRQSNSTAAGTELIVDFVSGKMHTSWMALEKAPVGSIRSRVHSAGLKLLARVQPSELFLKSFPKDANRLEILFPSSLNGRMVRKKLRHVALSGSAFHRNYMYGSIALLPFAALFGVVPLPNIPLFWNLYRAYSHWRALQGSERLFQLVSDDAKAWESILEKSKEYDVDKDSTKNISTPSCPWVLVPSKKLEDMVASMQTEPKCLSDETIHTICHEFGLDPMQAIKWRDYSRK